MADKTGFRAWFGGRGGRKEYWLAVAILFALGFALSFIPGVSGSNMGLTLLLIVVQVRRLHDFGRTGWWAAAATLAPVVVMLPVIAMASLDVAVLVALATELVSIALIGAPPGDPGENRFGPPAPFSWRRMVGAR